MKEFFEGFTDDPREGAIVFGGKKLGSCGEVMRNACVNVDVFEMLFGHLSAVRSIAGGFKAAVIPPRTASCVTPRTGAATKPTIIQGVHFPANI